MKAVPTGKKLFIGSGSYPQEGVADALRCLGSFSSYAQLLRIRGGKSRYGVGCDPEVKVLKVRVGGSSLGC